jgi:hypothetical protein
MKYATIKNVINSLDLLFNLKSAKAISELMVKHKIKGEPSQSDTCPVAIYISKVSKADAGFDGEDIEISLNNEIIIIDGTAAMRQFAENFDNEKYPKIISAEYLKEKEEDVSVDVKPKKKSKVKKTK